MKFVLVIDDDAAVRQSFVLAFEDSPHHLDVACSGKEGIAQARQQKYDLIFLDLKMPGLDGVETLKALRKLDPAVPVYIITGFYMDFFDQLEAVKAAGLSFELIQKPAKYDMIAAVMQNVLDKISSVSASQTVGLQQKRLMKLYITSKTSISAQAVSNLQQLMTKLDQTFELQVIDILHDPDRARRDKIWATPTLVSEGANKVCKIFGDLSDNEKILRLLNES